jgi:hypothetical protein
MMNHPTPPPLPASPPAEDDLFLDGGNDPIDDYFQDLRDAEDEIVECFVAVSKLVGGEEARRLFADFLSKLPARKRGRPSGMAWTRFDRALFFGCNKAPHGRKTSTLIAIAEKYRRSPEAAKQQLKRLRKDWASTGAIGQQSLIQDWYEPAPDDSRAVGEVFGSLLGTKTS